MKPEISEKLDVIDIANRIRLPESAMLAKIEATLIQGARAYCEETGYQEIPIHHITKATGACENFNTLFKTDLFEDTAYLNQTGQLLLEAFMHMYPKTYCSGPSFRKENKADPRHLAEFNLFEIEVSDTPLDLLQEEISAIFESMLTRAEDICGEELFYLTGTNDLSDLKPPYKAITYREALVWLKQFGLTFGDDLKADHEQELVKMNGGRPLFVTHYPEEIKFFNMRLVREDPTIVHSMDLLMPFSGESVGAAEREEDYQILNGRLEQSDMLSLLKTAIKHECKFANADEDELHAEAMGRFNWYMNVIREHPIRHAGCGIGISRVCQSVLRVDDIRKAIAFPINRETLF